MTRTSHRSTAKFTHKSKPREIERQVLPNGVRVITERMPHVRSVSVGLWIGTGSREEEPHETGLSHFVEHMVFKGTKHRYRGTDCPVGGFHRRRPGCVYVQGASQLQRQGAG